MEMIELTKICNKFVTLNDEYNDQFNENISTYFKQN